MSRKKVLKVKGRRDVGHFNPFRRVQVKKRVFGLIPEVAAPLDAKTEKKP